MRISSSVIFLVCFVICAACMNTRHSFLTIHYRRELPALGLLRRPAGFPVENKPLTRAITLLKTLRPQERGEGEEGAGCTGGREGH